MIKTIIRHFLRFRGPKPCVTAIIKKGDKVLLTRRGKAIVEGKKWCLPGGHIEKWETAEEALKRETKEEIGVDAKKVKFLFYYDEFVKRIEVHSLLIVFSMDFDGVPRKSDEVSESRWFGKEESLKLDLAFKHKGILRKFWGMEK